jgi:hypothetical protein
MKTRTVLYAEEGMILTNGEIYGTQIFLAEGQTAEGFHEITMAEYEEIQEKASQETM